MTHTLVSVAGWSLGWLCLTAAVSFIGSICLLSETSKYTLNVRDFELVGRAVCIILSILAIVGLLLTSHMQYAFSVAFVAFVVQAWKAYDLILSADNGGITVSKWRTFFIVGTSLVTALCATVLAFA